jgi:hypothetical protein
MTRCPICGKALAVPPTRASVLEHFDCMLEMDARKTRNAVIMGSPAQMAEYERLLEDEK